MAIVVKDTEGFGISYVEGEELDEVLLDILADIEAEITALGTEICAGTCKVKAKPGSMAYTADMSAVYQMSPSGKWTKIGG